MSDPGELLHDALLEAMSLDGFESSGEAFFSPDKLIELLRPESKSTPMLDRSKPELKLLTSYLNTLQYEAKIRTKHWVASFQNREDFLEALGSLRKVAPLIKAEFDGGQVEFAKVGNFVAFQKLNQSAALIKALIDAAEQIHLAKIGVSRLLEQPPHLEWESVAGEMQEAFHRAFDRESKPASDSDVYRFIKAVIPNIIGPGGSHPTEEGVKTFFKKGRNVNRGNARLLLP